MPGSTQSKSVPAVAAQPDTAQIRAALRVLYPLLGQGEVVELRALRVPQGRSYSATYYGYFDDLDKLAACAAQLSAEGAATYTTLNPVLPALLARCANRVQKAGKGSTTTDSAILFRRWLAIDLDPERPAGISSTSAELEHAMRRGRDITAWLTSCGWPLPVVAMSGNGGHVCYQIHLANGPDELVLINGCLAALAARFGGDGISVDTTVGNAARIWKLYGSVARKGDNCPALGRTHRVAQLVSVPDSLEAVTAEQLRDLAASLPEPEPEPRPSSASSSGNGSGADWLPDWLAAHGVAVDGPRPWKGGRLWGVAACPFCCESDGAAVCGEQASGANSGCCGRQSAGFPLQWGT